MGEIDRNFALARELATGARVFQHAYGMEGIVALWSLSRKRISVATRQAAALADEECFVDRRRRQPSSRQSSETRKSPARRAVGSCVPSVGPPHEPRWR